MTSKQIQSSFQHKRSILIWLTLIPVIIYVYFLKWKFNSIHDDDLYILSAYSNLKTGFEKLNASMPFGQYRPVRDFFLHVMLQLFGKNPTAFYCFNVLLLTINAVILAFSLNLFLRSINLSFFVSLIIALSRFSFYTATQLFNGGLLEGLGLTFFLSFLYFSCKAIMPDATKEPNQFKCMLWTLLFANLAMYTHERFTSLFLFPLLLLFLPNLSRISIKQKTLIGLLAIASPFINIFLKKYILSINFMMGTGSTTINFSIWPALNSLKDSILAVFQISVGPPYVVGYDFSFLPFSLKVLVVLTALLIAVIFFLYLKKIFSSGGFKKREPLLHLLTFLSLGALFCVYLAPCIFQVRIELRWLQAPLCTLLVMIAVALSALQFESPKIKPVLLSIITVSFLITHYYHIEKGAKNLYYSTSARIGETFYKAIKDKTIQLGKPNLYLWLKQRSEDRETDIRWALAGGKFFSLYQNSNKKIEFIDSTYFRADSSQAFSFIDFNKKTDQIVICDIQVDDYTFKYTLTDVTNQFLSDSAIRYDNKKLQKIMAGKDVKYPQNKLQITNYDFNKFATTGFYDHEEDNGIRWTTGKSSIDFLADFSVKDSATIVLKTYMPPPCKNITPAISIIGENNEEYNAVYTKREGDKFIYRYYIGKPTKIQKIKISSDTINTGADQRTLSFPFISLEILNDHLN